MASANIFSQLIEPVRSVEDYNDERAAREIGRLGLQEKRRSNALADAAFQQQTSDRSTLQRLAQESGGDENKLIAALRGSGSSALMDMGSAREKALLDRRKAEADIGKVGADTGKTSFETQEAKRKAAVQQIVSLRNTEDAKQLLNQQVTAGAIGMQAAQALGRLIDTDPEWKLRLVVGISDPKEMQAALQPHMTAAGGALVNTNPLAGPTGQGTPNAIPITQSADNAATQATSRANNSATIAAENQRAAARLTKESSVYDSDRGVVVNKDTGLARPAATMDGKPVGAKDKGLNDTQAKALLFGTRMQKAEEALSKLSEAGTAQRGAIKRTAEGVADLVPFMGDKLADAAGTLTNFTQSPEQQQVEQAQRDFLNAVLRRESGAAIGASEFSNGTKQYFPQPGDSTEVIAQKAANRQLATRLMLEEVPEGRRNAGGKPAAPTDAPWAPIKPGSVVKFDANGNRVQ